jgi:hypothetical protein
VDAGTGPIIATEMCGQHNFSAGLQHYSFDELVRAPGRRGFEKYFADGLRRYGDDGTWSAISIRVGTPPQWVDVMVSTVSSETWVVGPYGCDNSKLDPFCAGEIAVELFVLRGFGKMGIWRSS